MRDVNLFTPIAEHLGEQSRRVFVVVHHQHTQSAGTRLLSLVRPFGCGLGKLGLDQLQVHAELAAASQALAARLHLAAVQLDERAHDRQAEAETALRTVERLPLLDEQVEDRGQHLGRECRCRCRARRRARAVARHARPRS